MRIIAPAGQNIGSPGQNDEGVTPREQMRFRKTVREIRLKKAFSHFSDGRNQILIKEQNERLKTNIL
jgi:hypothetical protein